MWGILYIQSSWNGTVIDDGEIDGDSKITFAFYELEDKLIVSTV